MITEPKAPEHAPPTQYLPAQPSPLVRVPPSHPSQPAETPNVYIAPGAHVGGNKGPSHVLGAILIGLFVVAGILILCDVEMDWNVPWYYFLGAV